MGQEIARSTFDPAEHAAFRARLREETAVLKRWFEERAFAEAAPATVGLELEAWLIDRDGLPAPRNAELVATVNDPHVVLELSKFNFELNVEPERLIDDGLDRLHRSLEHLWRRCSETASGLDMTTVAVGILPTVRDEMLQPEWMSDAERYRALNRELFALRAGAPLSIDIAGDDHLRYQCGHVMLEAACTSLQAHLKVTQDQAARYYNASLIAAGPLVAASANAPFLYGKALWEETRVPAFEQSTALHSFHDAQGRNVLRVTLGGGYLRHSLLEPFLENLSYPALLPALCDPVPTLPHLRLHNGAIWRWVRPILGFEADGTPHLRLEHRVMPAGPSLVDEIANLALCFGLILALGEAETPPETTIPFEEARANFYACARNGLRAQVSWQGRNLDVQTLLLEELAPMARDALARAGVHGPALAYYFDEVLHPRLLSGRTGSTWQRSFVALHGRDFQGLLARYVDLQSQGRPVHEWTA